ncbi:MAG: hypothetical protein C9356_15870 [Oleiphilus sp.]|nr:MAG: hypothetical protein C9356_15870 [Oleiphilus sp.]
MNTATTPQAYIVRIKPGGDDLVPEALADNQLILGWAERGLMNPGLGWLAFREIIARAFYPNARNYKPAGAAAGATWRFLRECQIDDYAVVPHNSVFYVARITGEATLHESVPDAHYCPE